jgi:hypothetical protein
VRTHRISTTIPQNHWELLNKYARKFGTQQKVLELALENLDNNSKKISELTPEEKIWIRLKRENVVCVFEKYSFKLLIENANIEPILEYFMQQKLMESSIEYFLWSPLKELSLKEIIDAIISIGKLVNWLDTLDYKDEGNHYLLVITQSSGPNISKLLVTAFESLFKNYGAKAEITFSPMIVFIKVFKKEGFE